MFSWELGVEFVFEVAESVFRDGAKTDALGELVETRGKFVEGGMKRGIFGAEGIDFRVKVHNSLFEAREFEVGGAMKGERFVERLRNKILI